MRRMQIDFTHNPPAKHPDYLVFVEVYATRSSMMRALRRNPKGVVFDHSVIGTYRAACSHATYKLPDYSVPCSTVLFNLHDLGDGTVAHEMTHAALDTIRHVYSGNPMHHAKTEERLATQVGEYCRTFWDWWQNEEEE